MEYCDIRLTVLSLQKTAEKDARASCRLSSAVAMGLRPTNRDENPRGLRRHPMECAQWIFDRGPPLLPAEGHQPSLRSGFVALHFCGVLKQCLTPDKKRM